MRPLYREGNYIPILIKSELVSAIPARPKRVLAHS